MPENRRMGREPIQIVEIDQDFCNLVYGEVPCTAATGTNYVLYSEDYSQSAWAVISETVTILGTFDGLLFTEVVETDGGFDPRILTNETEQLPPVTDFSNGLRINAAFSFLKSGSPPRQIIQVDIDTTVGTDSGNEIVRLGAAFDLDNGQFIEFNQQTRTIREGFRVEDQGDSYKFTIYADPDVDQMLGTEITSIEAFDFSCTATGVTSPPVVAPSRMAVSGAHTWLGENTPPYVKTLDSVKIQTGTQKCFNTRSTCQDPTNYDKGVQTLKFVNKQSPAPVDDYYIPSLTNVSVTPAKLNPGGADKNARALGQRATLTVGFLDHPHNDRIVDLYRDERTYDPAERGTFWTKWRARNPYYMQRPIRLISGYFVDGQVVEPITREFVITGFRGPSSNGQVTFAAKDVLTLAEDDKAQAPVASSGKLSADLTAGATAATLEPAGVGAEEYDASGEIRIGKEVISYTRTGDDLTLTRGQFGTEATAHDEGDTVQVCLRYVSQAPQDILEDLLLNYAGIPASALDTTQWAAEALDFLPRLYSAIITEPEGVSKLVSEMCQQMYFTIWYDERVGKVVLQAVRLAQEDEVYELNDSANFIQDSVDWKDLSDELLTQIWVYYGQIDPTDKIDQGSNYSAVAITADPLAEGPDKHNLRRVKSVFSRWIDATNASAAEDLGTQIISRYGNAPRQATFRVDAKDDFLWLGDFIRVTNRSRTNIFGETVPVNLQIFEAQEKTLGSEYEFTAQEFVPSLIGDETVNDPNVRTIPITSSLLNVNLRNLHDGIFGAPDGTETITFVVRSGVVIGGDTAGGGINVPFGQRVTTNDTYDAGTALRSGLSVGTLPAVQRRSIGAFRQIAAGADYDGLGDASWLIHEYPVSIALETGSWPTGVTLNLLVEAGAQILGEGAAGGCHNLNNAGPGNTTGFAIDPVGGGDGGDALQVSYPLSITNGGVIGAGAGAGCGIFSDYNAGGGTLLEFIPGGGAAGFVSGATTTPTFRAGTVNNSVLFSANNGSAVTNAAPGGLENGGRGGKAVIDGRTIIDALGGAGADLAAAGEAATFYSARVDGGGTVFVRVDATFDRGGLAGKAVAAGADMITWVNKGDVRGDEVV